METLLIEVGASSSVHAYVLVPEGWRGPDHMSYGGAVLLPDGVDMFTGEGFMPNVTIGVVDGSTDRDVVLGSEVERQVTSRDGQERVVTIAQLPGVDSEIMQLDAKVTDPSGAEVFVTCSASVPQWQRVVDDFEAIAESLELVPVAEQGA